jgi:hypothetical protein
MVLEDPLWQDGNDYPARLDRQFIEDVFNIEGVIDPSTGAMRVAPRAAGANMSVDIAAGRAVIKGDDEANQGSYRVISTAVENVPIGAAPGSDRRIDLVVARVRDAAVTGGVSSDWLLEVIPGTVAASPVAPAVPSTAIPLAEVTVTSTTTSITAAEITKDRRTAAQNAAYVARAGSVILVPAQQMIATFGAPTLSGIGAAGDKMQAAWLLDAAAAENLTGQIHIPQGWATVDVALWWTNAGTGTGDVKYHLITNVLADAGTLGGSNVVTSPGASAAPGQNVAKLDLIASGLAVSANKIFGFRLQRDGGNAADSLPNDCGVLAVEIRRAS